MSREGITFSQVADAANQLRASLINPTVDAVRAKLGNTGSKTTIAPLLRKWKAEQESDTSTAMTGLPVELVDAVKAVYERLQAGAQLQIDEMRTEFDTSNAAIAQQLAVEQDRLKSELATAERLSAERDALLADVASLRLDLSKEIDEGRQSSLRFAALQAENEGLKQRVNDHMSEIRLLAEQLVQARNQFVHYQESMAEQRQQDRQSYEGRISALDRDLTVARGYVQEHREALVALRSEKMYLEDKVAESSEQITQQAVQLQDSREAVVKARELAGTQQTKIEMLERMSEAAGQQNDQLNQQLEDRQRSNMELSAQVVELQVELRVQGKQLDDLKSKEQSLDAKLKPEVKAKK